jgi:hypothetical protein
MITTADFLGYIVLSFLISLLIGFIINGIFSLIAFLR